MEKIVDPLRTDRLIFELLRSGKKDEAEKLIKKQAEEVAFRARRAVYQALGF